MLPTPDFIKVYLLFFKEADTRICGWHLAHETHCVRACVRACVRTCVRVYEIV